MSDDEIHSDEPHTREIPSRSVRCTCLLAIMGFIVAIVLTFIALITLTVHFPAFSLFYSLILLIIGLSLGIYNTWKSKWRVDVARVVLVICATVIATIFIGSFTIFISYDLWVGHFTATSTLFLATLFFVLPVFKKSKKKPIFEERRKPKSFVAAAAVSVTITIIIVIFTIGLSFAQPEPLIAGAQSPNSGMYIVTLVTNVPYDLDVTTAKYWNCYKPTLQAKGLPSGDYNFTSDFFIKGVANETQKPTSCYITVVCNHFVPIHFKQFYIQVLEAAPNQTMISDGQTFDGSSLLPTPWISLVFLMLSPFLGFVISRVLHGLGEVSCSSSSEESEPEARLASETTPLVDD